ncbi:prepilin peptidase [Alloiococcus sp. CFN-8]|uniref:prepilin peptidase n=1 Tax=Alloiococcus sp. CFN-8 TaxID=3416081 RepID=UPI003CF152A1
MIFLVTIFGLIMGSFLNVCISRIPAGESIAFPPSHCSYCGARLKSLDLIPVMSYGLLKGRCRYCSEKLSIEYPAMELFCALLYISVYLAFGLSYQLVKGIAFVSIALVIGAIDFKTQEVYTSTTITGGIVGIAFIIFEVLAHNVNPLSYIAGGIISAIFIGLIVYITRGMGEGDIEIAAICGVFLGIKLSVAALFIALVLGGIGAALIIIFKKRKKSDAIAFGPYLFVGGFIAMVFGERLIEYYLLLF